MEDLSYVASMDRYDATKVNLAGNLEDFVFGYPEDASDVTARIIPVEEDPDYIETIHYRGFDIPIFYDDPGQQYYCRFTDGEEVGFGSFNADYKDDLKYIIDRRLDTIHVFDEPYQGARLEYFDNSGFRDIRLVYRMRTLKVFVTASNFVMDYATLEMITSDSQRILATITGRAAEEK